MVSEAYRIFIAGARYLQDSPAINRVKQHDRTVLGDFKAAIDGLLQRLAGEDAKNHIGSSAWAASYHPACQAFLNHDFDTTPLAVTVYSNRCVF